MKTAFFRIASTLVIGVGLASSAPAADMGFKPRAVAPAATYDWSGLYLGGVLGGGWEKTDTNSGVGTNFFFPGGAIPPQMFQTTTGSSFIGGIEGGSNYQIGKLVVGWEGDILWGDIKGSSATAFGPAAAPVSASLTVDTPWTATVASRVGIAHDRWLAYGKAGVAYEHTDFTGTASSIAPLFFQATGSDNRTGWLVGGGLEYAAWDNWTIKGEYDYLDFGTRSVVLNGATSAFGGAPVPTVVTTLNNQRINEFKFGINWKFMPNLW